MKKILITGGAGFIGFHLCKKFIDKGFHVDIADNFKRGMVDFEFKNLLKSKHVNIVKTDLLNINLKKWKKNYNKIFHLAAIIGVKHVNKNPKDVAIHNIKLLDNVLNIAKEQKKLDKFVFFSTSEVYSGTLKYHGLKIPTPEKTNLTVDDLHRKRTSYMLSKIYGEYVCNISKNLPHINIRPHNFYGPRMGFSHVIPELFYKMYKTKNGMIHIKSPNHKRTFCYIEDAINMIYELSIIKKSNNNTFNIGSSEKSLSMFHLAKIISSLFNKKIVLLRSENEIGSPKNRQPDISKLKNLLNYKQAYSLQDGLKKTFDWYLKNIFIGKNKTFI